MLPVEENFGDGVGNIRSSQTDNERLSNTSILSPTPGHPFPRPSVENTQTGDAQLPAKSIALLDNNDPKDIILRSFQPRVAVFASADTEELIRLKGIYGGLCGLLKPFGESLAGNVVIRDSVGGSKSWNNFGVHFIEYGNRDGSSSWPSKPAGDDNSVHGQSRFGVLGQHPETSSKSSFTREPSKLDDLIERCLSITTWASRDGRAVPQKPDCRSTPPYYGLYLEKLLYRDPMVPYETMSHPVACVIAISSQCSTPIETLRELYRNTGQGVKRVPLWAGNEFLRYYVLVHDEDHDDITKSTALFDQMKRHFGLHCHLLRLRSVECTENEEDSTQLPRCRWLSPEEDLYNLRQGTHSCHLYGHC